MTSPPRRSIQDTALELIKESERRIIVSSFGWALDHPVTQALIARANAGVKVTVLARIRPAAMPALAALAEAGAEVYGFNRLHAKAIWTDRDRAMIMTANIERLGMEEGFELGLSLDGNRTESLRHILEGCPSRRRPWLHLEAKVTQDMEKVKLWKDGDLKDMEIPANLPVDLETVTMRSLGPLPECPAMPAELPMARKLSVTWRIDPPRVDARAIHIDVNGKEVKKYKGDSSPTTFPALMREPSGRRVVVISDLAQLEAAERLFEAASAKAVVMTRECHMSGETLLCWASVNHGTSVLTGALEALAERGHSIERVLLLVQEEREAPEDLPAPADRDHGAPCRRPYRPCRALPDPAGEAAAAALGAGRTAACECLARHACDACGLACAGGRRCLPARHPAVVLGSAPIRERRHGSLRSNSRQQPGSRLCVQIWRRPRNRPPTTLMRSGPTRRAALDRLARYALVPGVPLLILGERGVGKTRVVESLVAKLKGGRHVVTLSCGHLRGEGVEALLFGRVAATNDKVSAVGRGLLHEADGGIVP